MENEIWRPIKGYEGLYEVSNSGRVKSLARIRPNGMNCLYKERILNGELSKNDILKNYNISNTVLNISYVSPDEVILVKPKKEVNANTINSLQ